MNNKVNNYSPISLGDTAGLSNAEWLKWREHGPHYQDPFDKQYIPVCIGGSAVSAIFGDNPWMSKLELYHIKSGTAEPKYPRQMNEEILESGHMLEDFVAYKFVQKMYAEGIKDIKMWNDTNLYQHPHYPFAVCNLDRRIRVNGVPGILECKTTGSFTDIALWKEGIVPKKYEWQCRYYMATMNLDYCYICCCWGFTLSETAVILIHRDLAIEKIMMQEVAAFVDCCEIGKEPEMQTGHMKTLATYYTRLYGELPQSSTAMELPDTSQVYDLVMAAQTIHERKEKAKALVKQIEEEEYEIASRIMQLTKGKTNYTTYRLDDDTVISLKIKQPKTKAGFDVDRFRADHPDLFDKYRKEDVNVTELKKKEKEIARTYVIPSVVKPDEPCCLDKVEIRKIPASIIA